LESDLEEKVEEGEEEKGGGESGGGDSRVLWRVGVSMLIKVNFDKRC
jgi:hypothetical protein